MKLFAPKKPALAACTSDEEPSTVEIAEDAKHSFPRFALPRALATEERSALQFRLDNMLAAYSKLEALARQRMETEKKQNTALRMAAALDQNFKLDPKPTTYQEAKAWRATADEFQRHLDEAPKTEDKLKREFANAIELANDEARPFILEIRSHVRREIGELLSPFLGAEKTISDGTLNCFAVTHALGSISRSSILGLTTMRDAGAATAHAPSVERVLIALLEGRPVISPEEFPNELPPAFHS